MSDTENNNIIPISVKASPGQPQLSVIPRHGERTSLSEHLRPASAKEGNTELLACLILVAPSGMTADDRDAWLRAAKMTLTGIPAELLKKGCKKARETCRFASEIVPAIMGDVKERWDWLKRARADELGEEARRNTPRLEKPDYVTAEEARAIIAKYCPGALGR